MAAIIWWQRHPKYSWKEDLEYRLDVDFNKTREEVTAYIKQYIPEVTEEQIDAWTASGKLEAMERHGEIRYFKRAARNLFRLDTAAMRRFEAIEGTPGPLDSHSGVDAVNLPQIIADVKATGNPIAQPRRMRVKFTLTVEADAVPAGKTIRCPIRDPMSRARPISASSKPVPTATRASSPVTHRATARCIWRRRLSPDSLPSSSKRSNTPAPASGMTCRRPTSSPTTPRRTFIKNIRRNARNTSSLRIVSRPWPTR